jgi:argininosuccinate lyase
VCCELAELWLLLYVVYAQMGRGKMERNVAYALASVAGTVAKLAFDACMFNSQNFGS